MVNKPHAIFLGICNLPWVWVWVEHWKPAGIHMLFSSSTRPPVFLCHFQLQKQENLHMLLNST